jgi:hypothetical protein
LSRAIQPLRNRKKTEHELPIQPMRTMLQRTQQKALDISTVSLQIAFLREARFWQAAGLRRWKKPL